MAKFEVNKTEITSGIKLETGIKLEAGLTVKEEEALMARGWSKLSY